MVKKGSMLHGFVEKERIFVNSFHHQNIKDLAPTLEIDGVSEDGYIEAVHMPNHPFFLAVQWHPEIFREHDEGMRRVFRAFVDAARGKES
jgi:putative glutamine amidotransferase